jgi:2-isopropylmalate synthase
MSNRVFIFDTTLRDGEQSPGCSMNLDEKERMARQLEALGVDVIEAGFPMASAGDFEAVRRIAKTIERSTIAALSRAVKHDIDKAWEAIKSAKKPRIHTFIATSDIHLKHKLRKTRDQVLKDAVAAVKYSAELCGEVEFSCEDASRSDIDYMCEVIEAVIGAGASIINLPDTVGYALPSEYGKMFATVQARVPNIKKAILSTHCHNDLGLAVANSLAAIEHGARQVECTINGIGERAGNAALEEIAMALNVRREAMKVDIHIKTEEIYKSSKLLSSLTGMLVQRNKAIVGANAFAHEAGIHQDGVLKSAFTYEIMTPQSVGIKHSQLVLGKHSGRHALKQRYADLGFNLNPEELERVYPRFCTVADRKKEVYDEDLIALYEEHDPTTEEVYTLESIQVFSGTDTLPTASVVLRKGEERFVDSATGDGPIDATYKSIERITNAIGKLTEFSISSISLGHDAIGETFVRVDFDGVLFNGRATSTDIVIGSAKAYLEALNRALSAKRRKNSHVPNVQL